MDYPSAGTFGLLPGRSTAIAVSADLTAQLKALLGALDPDEEDDEEHDSDVEVVFEPWDDDLGVYIVGHMLDDDEGWDDGIDNWDVDDDLDDDER